MRSNRSLRFAVPSRVTLVCILICVSSCGGLEHVRVLRDAQNDFSELAREENVKTLESLFPDEQFLLKIAENWNGTQNLHLPEDLQDGKIIELQRKYNALSLRLGALTKNKKRQLKGDHLYGTAETLRILSSWRAQFYAHLLRVGKPAITDGTPEPLTVLIQEAKALLSTSTEEIDPRDRFMLEAMSPLVQYDLAVIATIRSGAEVVKNATDIINQITSAERALRDLSTHEYRHLEKYRLLARYSMLRTGRNLVVIVERRTNTEEIRHKYLSLALAIDQLRTEITQSGLFQELLTDADIRKEGQDTNNCLDEILPPIGPPNQ